jgi:hypothetical protein
MCDGYEGDGRGGSGCVDVFVFASSLDDGWDWEVVSFLASRLLPLWRKIDSAAHFVSNMNHGDMSFTLSAYDPSKRDHAFARYEDPISMRRPHKSQLVFIACGSGNFLAKP